ncbi:MAG: hypothetical protein Q7Q71_03440 [Verrucomicrobiota bacterium JB023]|nr:hypothetical protein [Verrucomicrobiota bacterium JB023]
MKFSLLVLGGLAAAVASARADVPDLINYQGYVTDTNGTAIGAGAPVNRKIVFRIYDDANAGNLLWTEEHTVTLVDGQFSILLGAGIDPTGTAAGESRPDLSAVFGSSGERYIGLTVDNGDNTINASDTEIAPRQRITSTAFALRAQTADRVADNSSLLFTGDSNHGVGWFGTGRPFNGVNVNGPVLYGYDGGALGAVQGGTQSTALRWESDGDVSISKDLAAVGLSASGNVAIGGTLTVASTSTFTGTIFPQGGIHFGGFGADPNYVGSTGNFIAFGHSGASEDFLGYKSNTFYFKDSPGGGDSVQPNVVVGGKLGVGVDEPAKALEVSGEMSSTGHATVGGNLTVSGGASVSGNLTANGGANFTNSRNSGNSTVMGALLLRDDSNHGMKYAASYDETAVDGPVVYGFGGGALGVTSGGGEEKVLVWKDNSVQVDGSVTTTGAIEAKGKKVTVSESETRIIRGVIKNDGTILSGSGFTVSKRAHPHSTSNFSTSTGHFYITFDEAFSDRPAVTATPYNSGNQEGLQCFDWDVDDANRDENHYHGVYSSEHDPEKGILVVSRNVSNGDETYHGFSFIAIGNR